MVETFQAAGVVSRALEDHYLGRVGLFRNQPGDIVVADADVLVTVGYDPVEYDPVLWNADVDRTVVHIDTIPADVDNHYQPVLELRGSVAATLDELTPLLSDLHIGDVYASELARQRRVLADIDEDARCASTQGDGVNPAALVLALRDGLDDDATVACDIGSVYIYMARHFRVYQPRQLLFSNGQQTLGVGLPWAMAASHGPPRHPGGVHLRRWRIPVLRTGTGDRDTARADLHPRHHARQHLRHGGLPGGAEIRAEVGRAAG